jgi:hypothetical protein
MRKSSAAHPAQQLRGSGDFWAWADSGLFLTRQGNDRVLVVEHRGAPAPPPFRLRLVPGNSPHLVVQDTAAPGNATDPLEARILEHLDQSPRPQPTVQLRDALRVRKADLVTALNILAARGLVKRSERGWALSHTG